MQTVFAGRIHSVCIFHDAFQPVLSYASETEPAITLIVEMTMQSISAVSGRGIPLLLDDIDTDRIIPARFLRCVSFDGLGEHAFEDDRKQDPQHPFNNPKFREGSILIAGRNFGCGSSREHAPQSLMRWGIKAIVAESFAEIFFGNCTALGIPAVTLPRADLERIAEAVRAQPETEMTVDLQRMEVRVGGVVYRCQLPDSARHALVSGEWDFLGQLLENQTEILESAGQLPYLNGFSKV